MATRNHEESRNPWLPVHGDGGRREAVAPSKPAMPSTGRTAPRPEPIDTGDADVLAPVALPPQEEILPQGPSAPTTPSLSRDGVDPAPVHQDRDPFTALGDAAVRSASLSASGAPTPLGGVPRVPAPASDSRLGRRTADDHSPATHIPPTYEVSDDSPAYTPRFDAGSDPEPQPGADRDGSDGDGPASAAVPWWRSVPALVIAGLLVMGAVGYGVYLGVSQQEPVELTPAVIVAPPEIPALDPITIDDPTALQAAMPGTVGTYALTAVEAPEVADADLAARAAEIAVLTYGDQQTTLTVRAIQHFDVEAANAQFEALAVGGTDRAPVEAAGTTVGDRVTVPTGGGQAIVWRNGTVVFELTGPVDTTEAFFTIFPL